LGAEPSGPGGGRGAGGGARPGAGEAELDNPNSKRKPRTRPALSLHSKGYGDADCLFADGQEAGLMKVIAGDAITVRGEIHKDVSGKYVFTDCELVLPRP
jgi:hypothetical protein